MVQQHRSILISLHLFDGNQSFFIQFLIEFSCLVSYADVLVHRLLAAGITADATFPDLLNKRVLQQICNNLNYRHRMAQYAARASVDLHTQVNSDCFLTRSIDCRAWICSYSSKICTPMSMVMYSVYEKMHYRYYYHAMVWKRLCFFETKKADQLEN